MKSLVVPICVALLTLACEDTAQLPVPTTPSSQAPPTGNPPPGPATNLPTPIPIAVGQLIHATVAPDDPACFPNWDAGGRCQLFALTPPFDGELDVILTWTPHRDPSVDLMDLFIIPPGGGYLVSYEGTGQESLLTAVKAGLTYELWVMSYSPSNQQFALRTALQAN